MTKLKRPVSRETMHTAEQGRPIIVTLEPGDMISFRQKGRRKSWRTTIGHCFWRAVRAEGVEQQRTNKLARAERARRRR